MQALPDPKDTTLKLAADAATSEADANKQALHLMLGAQRMIFEEMAFAACAMLDRERTETHLFGEFAAKLAESHSVRDWSAMGRECSQHQLEFARRDCERLFKHGARLMKPRRTCSAARCVVNTCFSVTPDFRAELMQYLDEDQWLTCAPGYARS